MSFRLVPKSVTLDDLERRNGRCIVLFHCVQIHNRIDLWLNLCTSLLYFVVRVRCRRKESSRSLSHLLMSFLLYIRYKNFGSRLFRFVTVHAFDRQTEAVCIRSRTVKINKMIIYRRETALRSAFVLAKSGKLKLRDNILRTL